MMIAYLDEIGEPGAFVSKDDSRYNTSPAFGYAGFILPEDNARKFGAIFAAQRNKLYADKYALKPQFEVKGANAFRSGTMEFVPEAVRVFRYLSHQVNNLGGTLFYYADEKLRGTPKQVGLELDVVESKAMVEALNRLCRHADKENQNLMVLVDQVNEKTRKARLPGMYSHILGRASEYPEMRRIVEPPMHVDSLLSSGVQFADWVAAYTSRAIEYQLLDEKEFVWVGQQLRPWNGRLFSFESKLHLQQRSIKDFVHSSLFNHDQPLFPRVEGQAVGDRDVMKKLERAYYRSMNAQ